MAKVPEVNADGLDGAEPAGDETRPAGDDPGEGEATVDEEALVEVSSETYHEPGLDDLDAAAEAMEGDLEALRADRDQMLEFYRRSQAEFANYKKRTQKEVGETVDRQLGGFVERLLPVLDACDAAAAQGASEAVEPIMTALFRALEKEGLERIDPKGEAFDPAFAEAVLHEPGEGDAQLVAEVLRPGYRWRGRVLRPAQVKVTD